MAVPRCVLCCSLRGFGIARTAGWSDGWRSEFLFFGCRFKWAPTGGPWANQRAGRRSGASLDTTRPGLFQGLQPSLEGHGPRRTCRRSGANLDTTWLGPTQCQASTGKKSTETSVRRSVIFNPQGWETVFGRYPARYPGRRPWTRYTYWVYDSTQCVLSLRLFFCPGFLLR